ncbi:MAG: haloacid dehalogenase type II [Rhodospirillales bacterium]
MSLAAVTQLVFDVYGTVVDWRTSIADEGRALAAKKGIEGVDWEAFASAWRAGYHPAMDQVRKGERPWTTNDDLQRARLDEIVQEFGIEGLNRADRDGFNLAWHRLRPWPDAIAGLTRLKAKYVIGTLSNGSFHLLANMARHAGLPWDCIISADNFRHFKPDPELYLGTVDLLGAKAGRVMLVAAHNYDLAAARASGLGTAFVPRPTEYGPGQKTDLVAEDDWDIVAEGIDGVADALGV